MRRKHQRISKYDVLPSAGGEDDDFGDIVGAKGITATKGGLSVNSHFDRAASRDPEE